jgi:TPR repeat protein
MRLQTPGKSFAREPSDHRGYPPLAMNEAIELYNESLDYLLGDKAKPVDVAKSFALNKRAAELRYSDAILAMGWFYVGGRGVARDVSLAQSWYRRSARDGEPRAMFSLGQIAYSAGGYDDARRWFERASNHGNVRSLYWLGKLAWRGHGVPRDPSAAFTLFHRAAQGHDPEAIRALSFLSRRKSGR